MDLVDKYIKFVRKNGSRAQLKEALRLQLPSCPLYSALEGRVPRPADTYQRLIEYAEAEEKEFINREIGERRTRLGARIDQVTMEVKNEAFSRPELEELYRGLIDWTQDDDVRHRYEEKLLQRAYDHLLVLPSDKKKAKRDEVYRSAKDMVIIKQPFDLAWKIVLEWNDVEEFSGWDHGMLQEYTQFFPDDGLSKVLRGFLSSDLSPFPRSTETAQMDEKQDNSNGETAEIISAEERLLLMSDGLEKASNSVMAHRIMAQLYLSMEEHGTAVDIARKGLSLIKEQTRQTGVVLRHTTDAIQITLATALISHQSPRNHPEAKTIFEGILKRKPTDTRCLLGVGLILEEDQDYEEAVDFLQRARQRDPSNLKIQSEFYWCTALNGDLETGLSGLQDVLAEGESAQSLSREFKAELHYRIGYCKWELDPSPAARKDRNGAYASFLASIQSDLNYAPAYTSLGIFYADYKKDKNRARRCFHKAFELSASEVEAAERLARAFADQREWDLVEAVAQRVVESGKAKPAPGSKRRGLSWPYVALGVVQINRQQYSKSIVSYQSALRISPEDYHSWVGLGESYHNSGRYIAATKAFEQAESLEPSLPPAEREHIWFAKYMLANVKRELGEYEAAISRYEAVLDIRPGEFGVLIALLQTLVEGSWKNIETGLFNDAAILAQKAIDTAAAVARDHPRVFNLWKAVGDACAVFSYVKNKADFISTSSLMQVLSTELDEAAFEILADGDGIGTNYASLLDPPEKTPSTLSNACIFAAILAFKRAVHVSADDVHARAVSWYNLGWAEYRAYRIVEEGTVKKEKKRPRKYLKTAIRCFKKAIELEAGNAEFWNALGVVTSSLSPKVAQHAFVRSLHLNERSAQNWTNLGAFYLINHDLELSNHAFTRAQSADPDYAPAWLGQGFLAMLFGDPTEARALFTHAFDISSSFSVVPKRQYSLSLFDHLIDDLAMSNNISQLIRPLFALHQLHCQEPSDYASEHLAGLLAERIGEFSDAVKNLEEVSAVLEAEYEVEESPSTLVRFALASADVARVHLANGEFEAAAEKAETALSLSAEDEAAAVNPDAVGKLRLSAHLTAGLAYYYLKSMDQAIDMFRDALHEAENAPEVVCLLAQVLWAKGGEEERSVARQQLFDCVERFPDHVGAVTLLGAIALLDGDEDAIAAVHADMETARTRDDVGIQDRAKIAKLLATIKAIGLDTDTSVEEEIRQVGEAATAVMLAPGQPQGWMELAAASGEYYPAKMAIRTALQCVPPRGNFEAGDLCEAYVQTGTISDSMRAIMVAPWKREGWEELRHAISGEA